MGVVSNLKKKLGLETGEHVYECADCGEEFSSPMASQSLVSCPACGSENAVASG